MVAVARFISDDPHERDSIPGVLRAHLEPGDFVERVCTKAREMFPETDILLDTVGYDEWDPPVRMMVDITQPWSEFSETWNAFFDWVSRQPEYNRDLISVMPTWAGPVETCMP